MYTQPFSRQVATNPQALAPPPPSGVSLKPKVLESARPETPKPLESAPQETLVEYAHQKFK